jgi:hypothetical protein
MMADLAEYLAAVLDLPTKRKKIHLLICALSIKFNTLLIFGKIVPRHY